MAIPQLFNPIKKPIQTGVVWAFWQQVTWPAPKKKITPLPDAIKPAVQMGVVGALNKQVTPQTVASADKWIKQQQKTQQAEQQKLSAEQTAMLNQSANTFKDLYHDIAKGTDEEILKAYPELWGDAKILKEIRKNPQLAADLYWDLQKPWVTQEKIQQAYPEIYGVVNKKWWVLNYLMGMGKQSVSTFGTNLVSWALDLVWADKAREKVQGFQEFVKWEEEASLRRQGFDPASRSFKAGETTSNIALSTAPTLITWWAWLGAVRSLTNPLARWAAGAALWWVQWLVSTNLAVAWAEWRKATTTENLIGWWLGAIMWWVAWYRMPSEKWLTNIIKERDVVKNQRAALDSGTYKDQPTGLRRWLFGADDVVEPSKRTEAAVKTISSEIKKYSNKPWQLYTQVKNKIDDLATWLWNNLKQVKTWTLTHKNKVIKDSIRALADEVRDISPATAKKIDLLLTNLSKSQNADEVWAAAKKLDMLVWENVKRWVNLSAKDQYIYDAWRAAREAVNDHLDEIAEFIPDTAVKETFKKLSNLYHAKAQIKANIWALSKPSPWLLSMQNLKRAAIWAGTIYWWNKVLDALWWQ